MSLLWREQLSVGNDVIDLDHQYLIEIINRAEASLNSRNRHELDAALDDLGRYSLIHFEREEKIASAVGYTQVSQLSRSHHELMDHLNKVRGEMDVMGQDWSTETINHFTQFLRDWLINHVIKEYLLMKPTLQKHSPSFDPR